jgi:AraC family ethanolamine operon transcriptional activator
MAMTKLVFRDFDEFAAAINGIAGQFVPTARSQTEWFVQAAPLDRVAMQQVQIGGATTFAGDGTPNAFTIGIPLSDWKPMRVDGDPLRKNSFLLVKEGQPFTFAAGEATSWSGIVIPTDHALLSPDLVEALNSKVFHGKTSAIAQTEESYITRARLQMSRIFTDDSVEFRNPTAVLVAEEEIMAITTRALESSHRLQRKDIGRPRYSRHRVLGKALELIEASADQPLLLQDLCRATAVSERTLRNVFHEYFNVGPMRLLKVRQLHEIRAALLSAEYGEQTVADIAARFGVWDFSSFARNYRALYDEAPSRTLRSKAKGKNRTTTLSKTWIRYATEKFAIDNSASGALRKAP